VETALQSKNTSMKTKPLFFYSSLLIIIMMTFISCSSIVKGGIAVTPFDKEKYLGKWYEIARMDFKFERNLNNSTANYSVNTDGSIKVENRGFNYQTKVWKEAIGKAKFAGDPNVAMLKVSFFGPFYAGYNVIALDKDYKYALIAGQNLKYLWLLSREMTIPEDIKLSYLKIAENLGYNTSKLVWVAQDVATHATQQ
jgi:apolipoprotein D and lipocalin family protein